MDFYRKTITCCLTSLRLSRKTAVIAAKPCLYSVLPFSAASVLVSEVIGLIFDVVYQAMSIGYAV